MTKRRIDKSWIRTLAQARDMLEDEFQRSVSPPLLPRVARQVIELTNNPEVSLRECEEAIEEDPVLVSELMQTANSPFYRGRVSSLTLRDAISRVGLSGLRRMLNAASTRRVLTVPSDPSLTEQLQERSVAVALAARAMAQAAQLDADRAYMAGLVHDIGWTVIYDLAQRSRSRFSKSLLERPRVMRGVAAALHALFGRRQAERWELSEEVIEVVALHHRPEKTGSEPNLAYLCAGALRLCDSLDIYPEVADRDLNDDPVFATLGYDGLFMEKLISWFQVAWANREQSQEEGAEQAL